MNKFTVVPYHEYYEIDPAYLFILPKSDIVEIATACAVETHKWKNIVSSIIQKYLHRNTKLILLSRPDPDKYSNYLCVYLNSMKHNYDNNTDEDGYTIIDNIHYDIVVQFYNTIIYNTVPPLTMRLEPITIDIKNGLCVRVHYNDVINLKPDLLFGLVTMHRPYILSQN